MNGQPIYVLDADVFIQAARRYYAFDLAPGFWENLVRLGSEGRVQSVDCVKVELERGKDRLAEWAKNDFSQAFSSTNDDDVIEEFRNIMNWVQAQNQYSPEVKAGFAADADPWVVAYAKAKGCTVVTMEAEVPPTSRKVKIPNVCKAFGVPFVNTFEMLRALGTILG